MPEFIEAQDLPNADQEFENLDAPEELEPEKLEQELETSVSLSAYSAEQPQFDADEVFLPLLTLTQGSSGAVSSGKTTSGKWYMEGYEDSGYDTVVVVPLRHTNRREYLRDKADFSSLICHAEGPAKAAHRGISDNPELDGRLCKECPLSQWVEVGDKKEPPSCYEVNSWMVYVVEYETLAVLNFKRTATTPGKKFNSVVALSRIGKVAIRLGVDRHESGKNKVFIPTVQRLSNGKVADEAVNAAQQYR